MLAAAIAPLCMKYSLVALVIVKVITLGIVVGVAELASLFQRLHPMPVVATTI
jgi:hypothetical protein